MRHASMLRAFLTAVLLAAFFIPAPARSAGTAGAGSVAEAVQEALGSGKDDGQKNGETKEKQKDDGSGQPDETTPRGVVELYLKACNEGNFREASTYLDLQRLSATPETEQAATLAWQLKVVLDQKLWIDPGELSADPQGNVEDGAPRRDRIGSIESGRGTVHVALERIETTDGIAVWRFSSSTVARVPHLYEQFGYGPLGEHLPEFFFTVTLLRIQLWQWTGILLLVVGAYLLAWLAVWLVQRAVHPAVKRTRTEIDDRVLVAASPPARALVAIVVFSAASLLLRLAVPAQKLLSELETAAGVLAVAWLALRLATVFSDVLEERFKSQDRRAAVAVLPMGRRTVKVAVVLLATIAMMQSLGFNVTGLIASLGIGGLAVALAAQRSLENMFAGMSLISDQPVRVGDFCRFGDKLGWVEDIGLRSTRVRTLERSVVAVPNSQFADLHLDNLAKRDFIRFYTVLGLRYETRADQLRHVIIELRKMLVSHPKVSLEPFWRVRFIGFGDYSLKVEIFAYTRTTDYGEYRAIQEDLLLRIIDIVEASGTAMAFPSQTTYLGRDAGIDEERGEEAVGEVRALRDEEQMPFPGFAEKTIEEMSDSLPYPPEGAVRAG